MVEVVQIEPREFPVWIAWGFLSALCLASMWFYGQLAARTRQLGGKVRRSELGLADLFTCCGLLSMWAGICAIAVIKNGGFHGLNFGETFGATLLFAPVAVLALLASRGVGFQHLFGLDRMTGWQVGLHAGAYLLAGLPLVLGSAKLVEILMHDSAKEQQVVESFRQAVEKSVEQQQHSQMISIILAAAVIAPLAEETLFRGYLYPVFKRYIGPVTSALFTSAFFSVCHGNLAASLPLFLLAMTFTIAYEVTGTLLVPIAMHAAFNTFQLLQLYSENALGK